MSNLSRVVSAYDSLAAEYDRQLENEQWIRRALWRHFGRLFHAGDRILDLGCGTGCDTMHLANRGLHVTAVDISPGMVSQLRRKLAEGAMASNVDLCVGEMTEILGVLAGPFDGIVASFAALNTVDFSRLAAQAARLLRPRGRLIAHMLSPRQGGSGRVQRWAGVLVPFGRWPELSVRLKGQIVTHLVPSARQLYRSFFKQDFSCRGSYAQGLLIGHTLQTRLAEPTLDRVAELEAMMSRVWPLCSAGRFFVLDLERRPPRPQHSAQTEKQGQRGVSL